MMSTSLRVQIYREPEVFDQLKSQWNTLLARSQTNVIFLTWEWQSTWWQVYQAGQLWVVAVYDGEQLVGLAPWFIQARDDAHILRTIGCVDVTDYVDLLVEPEYITEVQTALAQCLYEHADEYDRVNLCNIPEASETCRQFPDIMRNFGFDADLVLQEVCPVIHLPDNFDSYLDMLDKKQRHEIKRKLRKAENEAEITHYFVTAQDDFEAETDIFLQLMAASQPAKAEFLQDPLNERFLREILRVTQQQGWLRLSFLKVNGIHAAAYCDFDYHRQMLVYNSGLLPDYQSHLSTGIVLLAYNIRHAIETGHTLYDFLRGNETYKYRMGAQDTRVFKLIARVHEAALA